MSSRMKVVLVGVEAFPYAKVGGLGDVLGALPRALSAAGADVTLILPRYRQVDAERLGLERVPVPAGWAVGLDYVDHGFGLLRGSVPGSDASVLFLENDHFFDRFSVYNAEGGKPFPDEVERWAFYQRGCLEACKLLGIAPDVVHAHDSQAGPVVAYLKTTYRDAGVFQGTATVFTVHNMAYQGVHGIEAMRTGGFPDDWLHAGSAFEFHGALNWMKLGLHFADVVTTVSPTYAREIQAAEHGHGLEGVVRGRDDVYGVLNGIDPEIWSPQRDRRIPRNYDAHDLAGKRECKRALLERVGLPTGAVDRPLIAFIGRLVPQKGIGLIASVLPDLLQHDVSFLALGSGADSYEDMLRSMEGAFPEKARALIGFDDELAHWIEAGADIFLMPSRYEPCGLNQLYSMAYGTLPVVHATGGLADTVVECPPWDGYGTGFRFHRAEASELREAIYRALAAYQDRPRWERLVRTAMAQDFTWAHAAKDYLALYRRAIDKVRGA